MVVQSGKTRRDPLSWEDVRALEADPAFAGVARIGRRYMERHDRRWTTRIRKRLAGKP